MKKNRRYPSISRSRTRYSIAQRISLSVGLIGCVALAAVCGRALDHRQKLAHPSSSAVWREEGRAALALPRTEQGSKELAVRAQVERLSGVAGRSLFSPERWQPSEGMLLEGVDVSDMFVQPFVLKRSLNPSFRAASVALAFKWERPDTFLDLILGQSVNGAVMMRFTKGGVTTFLRSHSGILIPGERVADESLQGCQRFEIAVGTDDVSVWCGERRILGVAYPEVSGGRVLVASNLRVQELEMLSIKGMSGESNTEDNA